MHHGFPQGKIGPLRHFITPKIPKNRPGLKVIVFHGIPNPREAIKGIWTPKKEEKCRQLEKVRKMLLDESEMVQLSAVEALAEIGDKSDIQRLEELAENTESDELLEAVGDAVMKLEERDE